MRVAFAVLVAASLVALAVPALPSGSGPPRTQPRVRTVGPPSPPPLAGEATNPQSPNPQPETCTASWYGERHRGLPTASGEPFDPGALTAASWHHPFGTRLAVRHPESGSRVTVRVNDRGPARRLGRCIDLSRESFRRLAPLETGLIDVTVEVADG